MSRYSKTKEKYLLTFYGIHDENAPDVLFTITNQGTDDRCANPRNLFRPFHAPHPLEIPLN